MEIKKNYDSLKKNSDFQNVYVKGKSKANRYLVMYVAQNNLSINRLGISVSKKVGNSVVRHHLTRLIREAYRLNKAIVTEEMKKHEGKYLTVAFIWLAPELHDTEEIKMKIKSLLGRISERL